jgi:hypothetical protein
VELEMKSADEKELFRLTELLQRLDEELDASSPYREALMKGALALHQVFLMGHRAELEQQFVDIEKPLSIEQIAHLRSLGIKPLK